MTSIERERRARELFDQATGLSASERVRFLDRECGEDTELRARVERLLAQDDQAKAEGPVRESRSLGPQPHGLRVPCPHCNNPVELVEPPGPDVVCPSCGSTFELTEATILATETSGRDDEGKTFGRFEVLNTLGMGGFGTVYKARDPQLDRVVALKVLRAGNLASNAERDRLFREARATAQLKHPSIVAVHEVGEHDAQPFLVSEFVEGEDLADWLKTKRLTFRESAALTAEIADALQAAHEKGIVHRDIKPKNVMIDDQGHAHVMDFGLAKREAGEITMTFDGQVLGTPAYMSPEQIETAHSMDGRGDIYSLGVLLYRLLTGDLPFRGNRTMLLDQILRDDPKPPRSLNDRIPGDLDTICLKAMAKEPSRRYQTAAEFAADLRRWLDGEPILARPPSKLERARKFVARNRALVAATSTVFLALVIAIVALFVAAYGASQLAEMRGHLLEKEVAARNFENQLRLTEQQKRFEDVRSRGRLALERGAWGEAINASKEAADSEFQTAFDEANRSSARYWLDLIRAYDGLGKPEELKATLKELTERIARGLTTPTLNERGEFLIREAEQLLEQPGQAPRARSKIAEAIALLGRLEEPRAYDQALIVYAKGLVAPTASEAASLFRQAIEFDPQHCRARANLAFLWLILGEQDQLRSLLASSCDFYPEDPNYRVLFAIVLLLRGEADLGRAQLEKLGPSFDPEAHALIQKAFDRTAVVLGDLRNGSVNVSSLVGYLPLAYQLSRTMELRGFFRAPPACLEKYAEVWKQMATPLFLLKLRLQPKTLIPLIDEALAVAPEGTLLVFKGMIQDQAKAPSGCLDSLVRALDAPIALPALRPYILTNLIGKQSEQIVEWSFQGNDVIHAERAKPGAFPDAVVRGKLASWIRELLRTQPRLDPVVAANLWACAWYSGDLLLAEDTIRVVREQYHDDPAMLAKMDHAQDKIDMERGNMARIVRRASKLIDRKSDLTPGFQLRAEARKRLEDLLRELEADTAREIPANVFTGE